MFFVHLPFCSLLQFSVFVCRIFCISLFVYKLISIWTRMYWNFVWSFYVLFNFTCERKILISVKEISLYPLHNWKFIHSFLHYSNEMTYFFNVNIFSISIVNPSFMNDMQFKKSQSNAFCLPPAQDCNCLFVDKCYIDIVCMIFIT